MYISNPVKIAVALGLGLAIGTKAGWKFAQLRLDEKYNKQMEEEIARTKAFYAHVNKAEYPTPREAAEAFGVTDDEALINAAEALKNYQGKSVPVSAEQVTITHEGAVVDMDFSEEGEVGSFPEELNRDEVDAGAVHNVFQLDDENIDVDNRDPKVPYQITQIEFLENDPEHEQVSITYFAGDGQLADENDRLITDHKCVGKHNLEKFGTGRDPNVVMVRNEKLRVDYEITRSDGKYAHEVAGFQHSDSTFEGMRRTRRSADE